MKYKLIIFFGVIAFLLLVLGFIGLYSGGSNIEAAEKMPNPNRILVTFDDHRQNVSLGDKLNYSLSVYNSGNKEARLRIFGYVGLPERQSQNLILRIFPDWAKSKILAAYPAKNYFQYLVSVKPLGTAAVKLPIQVKKYPASQGQVYSRVQVQMLSQNLPWWNIFRLGSEFRGPVIASVEDVDSLE